MFRVRVKESEKALIYKDEKFVKLLDTGVYKLINILRKYRVEKVDKISNGISGDKAKLLYKNFTKEVEEYFNVVDLKDYERAFVKVDGKFSELLPLGAIKLYFKELNIELEVVDVRSNYQLSKEQVEYIKLLPEPPEDILKVFVSTDEEAYIFKNGEFQKRLDSGVYYFFNDLEKIEAITLGKYIKELELNQQELLTKDKVTIRLNGVLYYKISDGLKYITAVDDSNEYIYKSLQFALREYVSAYTIDELLQNEYKIPKEIIEHLKETLNSIGVEFQNVHIKDIILPGEMREIFNQVIEAQKRAEANIIKRREETAATRSLLNTAKLMKDNPTLARLKELEAVEKIVQSVDTLNIYGGLEAVVENLVKLK